LLPSPLLVVHSWRTPMWPASDTLQWHCLTNSNRFLSSCCAGGRRHCGAAREGLPGPQGRHNIQVGSGLQTEGAYGESCTCVFPGAACLPACLPAWPCDLRSVVNRTPCLLCLLCRCAGRLARHARTAVSSTEQTAGKARIAKLNIIGLGFPRLVPPLAGACGAVMSRSCLQLFGQRCPYLMLAAAATAPSPRTATWARSPCPSNLKPLLAKLFPSLPPNCCRSYGPIPSRHPLGTLSVQTANCWPRLSITCVTAPCFPCTATAPSPRAARWACCPCPSTAPPSRGSIAWETRPSRGRA